MATRVQAPARPDHDYDHDIYAWSKAQADLLRARRFDEVDLEHLIQEIEDVGASLGRSVRNRTITIIEHLLKLEHAPATDPRTGWRQTVRTQRVKLRRAFLERQQSLEAIGFDLVPGHGAAPSLQRFDRVYDGVPRRQTSSQPRRPAVAWIDGDRELAESRHFCPAHGG